MSDSQAEQTAASLAQIAAGVKMVEPMEPAPTEQVKFYHCTALNHRFIRTDGKIITFIHGIHESADENDQKYLDKEIKVGNPFLKIATEEQILAHRMRVNPHKTIEQNIRPQIVDEVSNTFKARMIEAREKGQINLTDEQIDALATFDTGQALLAGISGPENPGRVIKTAGAKLRELRGPGGSHIGAVNTAMSQNAADSNSR